MSVDQTSAGEGETFVMKDADSLVQGVEALLLASGEPLTVEGLAQALDLETEGGRALVEQALSLLSEEFAPGRHGFELVRLAGGWAFRTSSRWQEAVSRLFDIPDDTSRLSPAAMECLAIVAYLQPVSRPQIAEIRGVNSDSAVHTLIDRELITEVGRAGGAGGAVLYGTTRRFEAMFGLAGLEDLPALEGFALDEEGREQLRRRLGLLALPE